jgi:hypothetical protein
VTRDEGIAEDDGRKAPLLIRFGEPSPTFPSDLLNDPRVQSAFLKNGPNRQEISINISVEELCEKGADSAVLSRAQDQSVLVVEYAYGFLPISYLLSIPWSALQCKVATVELAGLSTHDKKELKRVLKTAGLHPAGGGIRATGTDVLFQRIDEPQERAAFMWRQFRFRVGRVIVWTRNHITDPTLRRARHNRLMSFLNPRLKRSQILDKSFGMPLEPFNLMEAKSVAFTVRENSQRSFRVHVPDDEGVAVAARECFAQLGVWPISFSFPHAPERDPRPLLQPVSSIIPGEPYSFDSPNEYLNEYASSHMAITHRKAGWDCFRHVEILASGSVPLLLDADAIPKYSMIHYPKRSFQLLTARVRASEGIPDESTRFGFHNYFRNHLTSRAMAQYMLKMAGLADARKVLFFDEALPSMPDYQSVLTLIGLKQVLGQSCEVFSPVEYLYDDWPGEPDRLYGRGFNYTRVVEAALRSASEEGGDVEGVILDERLSDSFDAIVVGSISRNWSQGKRLLELFPRERTVWIYGEDSPPNPQETAWMRDSQVHVFVRSIDAHV